MYPIVYIVESEIIRLYGCATIGKLCIDNYDWQAKKRTNRPLAKVAECFTITHTFTTG